MRIGSGNSVYEWRDRWAKIPPTESALHGWAHHGVAVTESGDVVTFHPGDSTILVLDDRSGQVIRTWDLQVADAHGITVVEDENGECLWIADNGRKRQYRLGYDYSPSTGPYSGKVLKTTLDGDVLTTLSVPKLGVYKQGNYSPTFVSVNEERYGGNGDIWVADGYGESYVHRYNKTGQHVQSINGEEGRAGRFNCPHGIFIDWRKDEPELYVADRSNQRVQVYDLDGKFKRAFGSDFLSSPSGFVTHGDTMIVAELRARLAVLDREDNLVGYLNQR